MQRPFLGLEMLRWSSFGKKILAGLFLRLMKSMPKKGLFLVVTSRPLDLFGSSFSLMGHLFFWYKNLPWLHLHLPIPTIPECLPPPDGMLIIYRVSHIIFDLTDCWYLSIHVVERDNVELSFLSKEHPCTPTFRQGGSVVMVVPAIFQKL